jgi:hypothetical protein
MAKTQPSEHWQKVRMFAEKWQWQDKRTGLMTVGYNPPPGVQKLSRVPFFVRYVTKKGRLESGMVISLEVDRRKHLRRIMFVNSGEIRFIWDFLIVDIDGTRIYG